MRIGTQAGADWRVLMSAALIGSGVGLSLGAAYLAGGMAQHAADHGRIERIAQAAAAGYSAAAAEEDPPAVPSASPALAATSESQAVAVKAKLDPREIEAQKRARELECLTQAVYYEARGEGRRGQAAVAQVVMNRVKHPAFPSTVCDVVFQGAHRKGCQFSFACDGSTRARREEAAWTLARRVASRALSGAALAEVGSATHFHTTAVSPAWGPQMRQVAQVGAHVFYKFAPRKPAGASPAAPVVEHAVMATPTPTGGPELRLTAAVAEKPAETALRLQPVLGAEAEPARPAAAPAEKGAAAAPTAAKSVAPVSPAVAKPAEAAAAKPLQASAVADS